MGHSDETHADTADAATFFGAVRMLCDIARLCNGAGGLSSTAVRVLERVREYDGWIAGRIYVVDSGVSGAAGESDVRPVRIGEVGSNAGLLDSFEPQLVREVIASNEPVWQRTAFADDSGVASTAVCAPITSYTASVGAMLLVAPSRPAPSETICRAIETVAVMFAGVVVQRRLERLVADAALDEQTRIGRELHDSVGQQLATLGLRADGIGKRLRARDDREAESADRLALDAREALSALRTIVDGLVPSKLPETGVAPYFDRLCEEISLHYGIDCRLRGEAEGIAPVVGSHLYFIVSEALRNAARHAQASSLEVVLDDRGDRVAVEVRDDGVGVDEGAMRVNGRGLVIMRHRAALIDGELEVAGHPEGGTVVRCEAPKGQPAPDSPEERPNPET